MLQKQPPKQAIGQIADDSILVILCFVLLFLLCPDTATCASLPKGLSSSDRALVLQTLIMGTAPKVISSPLPLGSGLGAELGLNYEFVPTTDLNRLGDRSGKGAEIGYPVLSFGKGLFYDIDLFLHFTPLPIEHRMSLYSGTARWAFYDAPAAPIKVSFYLSSGAFVYGETLSGRTTSSDFVASYFLDKLSFHFGFGMVKATGVFLGGTSSLNSDLESHTVEQIETHSQLGIDYQWQSYFFALEMNRYVDAVFAFKMGVRI